MKSKPEEKAQKTTNHSMPKPWDEMNRQQRRATMRKIQSADLSLEVVHPNAGGIDIGNESHYVAVPPDRDSQPVRRFGCTTAELQAMAQWLSQCGICTVAMQSTGVYWIAVYDILEEAGLEVYLVNARDTKNLPGHKSDVQESQWLMNEEKSRMVDLRKQGNFGFLGFDFRRIRSCTPTVCCAIRSGPRRRSARCGHTGGNAMTWCRRRRGTSSGCRRCSRR